MCGGCQVLPAHLKFVNHLQTVGKTCVPARQLMQYLDNHLLPDLQSAYRQHHSTETAVHGIRHWQPGDTHALRPVGGFRQC